MNDTLFPHTPHFSGLFLPLSYVRNAVSALHEIIARIYDMFMWCAFDGMSRNLPLLSPQRAAVQKREPCPSSSTNMAGRL